MNHLIKHGPLLRDRGYKIIPIAFKKKFPPIKGWQKMDATLADFNEWINDGHKGVGILCKNTPAVDLDIRDKELTLWMVDQVQAIAGKGPIRVGLSPKGLLPFKTLKPFPKITSKAFVDPQGVKHQVEIMGDGQQFVAFGIHPDTNKPYKWDTPLDDIDWDDLPTLGRVQGKEIADVFERKCAELGWRVWKKKKPNATETNGEFGNDIQNWTDQSGPNPTAPTAPQSPAPMPQANPEHGEAQASPLASFAEWDRQQDLNHEPLRISDTIIGNALARVPAEELDYDEWAKVGMALYHQFDGSDAGFDLWEEWSAKDAARFDPEGMPAKWKTFAPEEGRRPVTFASVLAMAKERTPAGSSGNINIPTLEEYVERYVYIESEGTVHDLRGPSQKTNPAIKNFRDRTANERIEVMVNKPLKDDPDRMLPEEFPLHALWQKAPERKWVSAECYVPNDGSGSRIVQVGGYNYLNVFRMPDFGEPLPNLGMGGYDGTGLLDVFLEHMEYLFPIKKEREWFISWMALNVKHPDNRCKVTPLHISLHQRTGRGWLVELMGKLLGGWNCTKTKMKDIMEGQWGNYLDRSLLCCIEETHEGGHAFEVSDVLRDILTENTLQLNLKYGGIETKRIYTNFFFMSNRPDALALKETDKRINVFRMDEPKRSSSYYNRLYKWSKGTEDALGYEIPGEGVRALHHWLMARDLSDFEWQESMESDSRSTLIRNSENKVEIFFNEIMETWKFDVITIKILKGEMGKRAEAEGEDAFYFESSKIDRQLTKMLQVKGWRSGKLVKVAGGSHRPWVSKNLVGADNEIVKEEISRFL